MTGPVNVEVAAALAALPLARLTHFTPALNLPGILADRQLRSVKDLSEDVRACYRVTDLQRLDRYPDKVSCSLQYPNGFYFDIARRKPDVINYPDWVCLLLDKTIAAAEGTLFCPRNAAAAACHTVPGAAGLYACYAPSVRGHGGQTRTRGPQHDPGSPTDVQAEVLVTAPVPLSAIYAIVFPTTGGDIMTSTADAMTRAARGIFLGAAVGDALGWPQEVRGGLVGRQKERDRATPRPEFRSWTRHAGHYSSRYRDPVRVGEYSDDTQLLLATARCCLDGERWWNRLTEVELPAWPLYQRGGGVVLTAAASWAEGRPPWRGNGPARVQAVEKRYRGAGANGVAMRIAPHVLRADDPDDLIRRILRDGITTHGHPRALVGALVYAFALRHAASSRATHGFGDSIEAATAGLIDVDRVLPALPPDWGTPTTSNCSRAPGRTPTKKPRSSWSSSRTPCTAAP